MVEVVLVTETSAPCYYTVVVTRGVHTEMKFQWHWEEVWSSKEV